MSRLTPYCEWHARGPVRGITHPSVHQSVLSPAVDHVRDVQQRCSSLACTLALDFPACSERGRGTGRAGVGAHAVDDWIDAVDEGHNLIPRKQWDESTLCAGIEDFMDADRPDDSPNGVLGLSKHSTVSATIKMGLRAAPRVVSRIRAASARILPSSAAPSSPVGVGCRSSPSPARERWGALAREPGRTAASDTTWPRRRPTIGLR